MSSDYGQLGRVTRSRAQDAATQEILHRWDIKNLDHILQDKNSQAMRPMSWSRATVEVLLEIARRTTRAMAEKMLKEHISDRVAKSIKSGTKDANIRKTIQVRDCQIVLKKLEALQLTSGSAATRQDQSLQAWGGMGDESSNNNDRPAKRLTTDNEDEDMLDEEDLEHLYNLPDDELPDHLRSYVEGQPEEEEDGGNIVVKTHPQDNGGLTGTSQLTRFSGNAGTMTPSQQIAPLQELQTRSQEKTPAFAPTPSSSRASASRDHNELAATMARLADKIPRLIKARNIAQRNYDASVANVTNSQKAIDTHKAALDCHTEVLKTLEGLDDYMANSVAVDETTDYRKLLKTVGVMVDRMKSEASGSKQAAQQTHEGFVQYELEKLEALQAAQRNVDAIQAEVNELPVLYSAGLRELLKE